MKKPLYALVVAIISIFGLVPVAFAFAEEGYGYGGVPSTSPPGVVQYRESDLNFIHSSSTASSTWEHGSSTPPMPSEHGKKLGIIKRIGTTTPPGFIQRQEGTNPEATSTGEHGKGQGGFVQAFLSWLFGQPGSTTVQDLKNEIASGTASTTLAGQAPPGPPGLLHKLLGWLPWF